MLSTTLFEVKSLLDLPALRTRLEALNLKPNFSKLAKSLHKDWRTVKRYYESGEPARTRQRTSTIDDFKELITKLLTNGGPQIFYYKRILWQYLKDNYGLTVAESTFRRYIAKNPEFQRYFNANKRTLSTVETVRYETAPGEQAQLDLKEDITFKLNTGETKSFNVLVMNLSYSRYKLYMLTQDRTQATLLDAMTQMFETFNGVPQILLTDNMSTVMLEPRTPTRSGIIHPKMAEFAKQFNFSVQPCIAGRPRTKGKVESQMKPLDEIHAYQGQLDENGLAQLVQQINLRSNLLISQATMKSPSTLWEKEKESLRLLPSKAVRDSFKIHHLRAKVNATHMVSINGCQYSVPAGYVGKYVTIQTKEQYLYIYDNTELIAQHTLSNKKLNYLLCHYEGHLRATSPYLSEDEIRTRAKENLAKIGEVYDIKD